MKVLFLNGSPHKEGVGKRAIREMQKIFEAENIECETVEIGGLDVRGCSACLACYKLGKCAIDDEVNAVAEKLREADALVISSPIYYAAPNGTMISFLNRLFYSSRFDKTMKVGAAITTARRGGITAGLDVVNKYFSICGMPIASGQYWNGLHGALAEVEDGVYQFSGKAVEETDGTTLGGAWRYDYLSFKFFGQAAWGAEYDKVTLTDEAKKYLQAAGNIELAAGVQLELGAEYVMTVTDCTPLDANNKFNCTIDFRKK